MSAHLIRRASNRGFTLIEMIVVTFLLLIAMLGLLAVFDASARINKNETDVADAQGSVRYGIYEMTRKIRMAGAGGLYVTQAVLNAPGVGLSGLTVSGVGTAYNNITAGTVTPTVGADIVIRPGTDMIEIRGVIGSPLLGFDEFSGCSSHCSSGGDTVTVMPTSGQTQIGQLVNDDVARRNQFAAINAYTATASTDPMWVIASDSNTDLHPGCSDPTPGGQQRYPQPQYNVGKLTAQTTLTDGGPTVAATFGTVNFQDASATAFNAEMPATGAVLPKDIGVLRRLGVMDDIIFFIAMLPTCSPEGPGCDPNGRHPYLAQGIRRGDKFEVIPLAEDVEDMQIAYGVDLDGNNLVTRIFPIDASKWDTDPNFSNQVDGDEWRPNVQNETKYFVAKDFQSDAAFTEGHPGSPPPAHCPRLHAVMISLLAKARDQDPTYKGPAATGYTLMDVPLTGGAGTPPVTAVTGKYRRRVQTLRINLRNYAFQG